ncbi:hypothetical protein M409DRAFT_24255 [Zasmidium cellare ATCC 36951]|uniref:Carbohydrate-binding module family 52 protein n=1 Tax=Zasmidium cellare ATCC 36951 TaxID=1080233 RepID=A0A6A6CE75_ZASCE|nr:uncharacterized protein M409DRAFT_24255 [Zasmidium cellare ATCC 36951]KAF2165405.1 hypothetical protein M409DRAFT_24255 [Zasmidium cellare ATCC 36951]
MRVLTRGAVLLPSLLPSLVKAQQCLTHPCPAGNYCYQGSCFPYYNPGPPPPSPCFNAPYSYACQNYCYYNYDPYCPNPNSNFGPYPPYQDPCIRNPYSAYCNPCVANPYAAGCPDPFAAVGGNPFTGDNRFINNFNPLGMFGGSGGGDGGAAPATADLSAAAALPADLGASALDAAAGGPPPEGAAAPPSRVRRAVEVVKGGLGI